MNLRHLLTVVLTVVALVVPAAAAAAHPVEHAGVELVNLRPAPGTLVAPGDTVVAALAAAGAPVDEHRVTVDGREVPATSTGGDHATVAATVTLEPGMHTVEVWVRSASQEARRRWSFTASGVPVTRLAGSGRIATAVAISRDVFPRGDTAAAAVLARGDDFPDALAGGVLARSVDGPLLLTAPDRLDAVVEEELRRVLPEDATVYLLGGEQALGPEVARQVEDAGFTVRRVAGRDRYATAGAIAELVPDAATAVVASGDAFADALSVAAPAADRRYPLLLTAVDRLPDVTRDTLANGQFATVFVVGGRSAVSAEVFDEIRAIAGDAEVVRLAGPSRYDTNAAVVDTFFPAYQKVALVNGERFPDALAGGPHAAAEDAPLLLVPGDDLLAPQAARAGRDLDELIVYGGEAAVGHEAVAGARRAAASAGGPVVTRFAPSDAVVQTLDDVVVEFDVDVDAASIYVTLGGHEVRGTLTQGDFPRERIFTVGELPSGTQPGQTYPVTVTVHASAGERHRFLERTFTYEEPLRTLSRGDRGDAVRDLQQRLQAAGYWVGPVDGLYGSLTHQAVLALQKVHGLHRDGVYGPNTRAVLESGPSRPQARSSSGLVVEIDKARQVVFVVSDGDVAHIFNSSTGTEQPYEYNGRTYIADTPPGSFRITRQIDGWRESHLGRLYRPKYFNGGIALHGSTSVPAYPASHGCVRVTIEAMDFLWPVLPIGVPVLVY